MADSAPHIIDANDAGQRWAQLRGRWGAAELGDRRQWKRARAQLREHPAADNQGWDLTAADWLDHVGAQLLWEHWRQQRPAQLRITPVQQQMLDRIAALTIACPPAPKVNWLGWLIQLGLVLLGFIRHVRAMVEMVGQLLIDVLRLLRNPVRGPWRGRHVGAALLHALVERARTLGYVTLEMHAQTHALAFYARHGFAFVKPYAFKVGEQYDEDEIWQLTL